MAIEVGIREESRGRLARILEAVLIASGGRAPLNEILMSLRKKGYDVSRLNFEDMGFALNGRNLELPGLQSGSRVTDEDDEIEVASKC